MTLLRELAVYDIVFGNHFGRDLKTLNSKEIELLVNVLTLLAAGQKLAPNYRDHALDGKFKAGKYRDCHLKDDLVLIYRYNDDALELEAYRVGTHSRLRLG